MNRNIKIDFLRAVCMFYITAVLHLSNYLGPDKFLWHNTYGNSFTWTCLGTFSLLSGYLLAKKYSCGSWKDALFFWKKRLLRFYPLFILSTICLYLIGFNDLRQSVYGLLGLAPFVSSPPKTLWYISMMIIFYLICPIVLVCNNKKRIIKSVLVFVFMAALSRFIHVDFRFIYNLLDFLIGVCFVGFEDKILKIKLLPLPTTYHSVKSKIVRSCIVIGIIAIYAVALFRLEAIKNNVPLCTMVNLLGIIVLIILANLINFEKCNKCNGLIYTLSYLSMSFYLFHRFTYWLFLEIYKPQDGTILLLYLLFIAVPLGMCFAYYIQKLYDLVMSGKKMSK